MTEQNKFNKINFYLTAYSGECFRFIQTGDNKFENIAFGEVLEININNFNINNLNKNWQHYFDLDFDYEPVYEMIENSNDEYLKSAANFCMGLKILNQEPFETLISFIISQQMQIPRIRKNINNLCEIYGKKIDNTHYAFPTVSELATASLESLQNIKLGYRAEYIYNAVNKIADGKFDLNQIYDMNYDDAKKYLKTLKGVGEKVANCVLLFAYHKTEAFPIDTWMKKIIAKYYNNNFDYKHYGKYAGIVQQYMFCYERFKNNKLK